MDEQSSMIERLGAKFAHRTAAGTVFGAPVERDGVTVIPVARGGFGFGGGERGAAEAREIGGGGGERAEPAGYITIEQGRASYHPIQSPWPLVFVAVTAGLLVGWLTARRR